MSAGSPKFTVSRIAALSLVSLWLAGCTSSSNPPAPVTSVDSGSSSNTNSGMLITPPPKMGATTQQTPQQAPQIQPVQRPVTQPMQTQPVTEQPVQMENGRIVYNRQYGNIPKGSYTGGSTYTVKKGDTLFYIALNAEMGRKTRNLDAITNGQWYLLKAISLPIMQGGLILYNSISRLLYFKKRQIA